MAIEDLAEQLKEAVQHIQGTITEQEILDTELEEQVEAVLAQHEIYYTKTELFIDSEELYEVLYEMEV